MTNPRSRPDRTQASVQLSSESDQTLGVDNSNDVLLDSFEAHVLTGLAFQMVDETRQSGEPGVASSAGAAVELFLVDGRVQMVVQSAKRIEIPVAQVTLVRVGARVVSALCYPVGDICRSLALGVFLGNHSVRVAVLNGSKKRPSVERRLGASTSFDVVDQVGCSCFVLPAERALQVDDGPMGSGVEVLEDSAVSNWVPCQKATRRRKHTSVTPL